MSRPVHVRHVVDGLSTDPGATAVLGRYFAPQDRAGVNGRNGYQSGQNNRKLREEADFTITFPNAPGADGIAHLERFLILALRNVVGDYKIGDEWLEVYEGEPPGGDLIACGTPIDYTIGKTSIQLQCKDALKTLVHARETAGGVYWCAAPRDAFEHYTQAWSAVLADDFPSTARFVQDFVNPRTTADGKWTYFAAWDGGDPGAVRIGSTGSILSAASVPVGVHQRVEATLRMFNYAGAGFSSVDLILLPGGGGGVPARITVFKDGTASVVGPAGGMTTQRRATFDPATPHRLAIELRDRWAYFYLDGKLLGVLAARPTTTTSYVVKIFAANSDVVVDSFLWRRAMPYLLRGSDPGDYRLPGAPAGAGPGLLGGYFTEVVAAGSAEPLNPLNKPYARRVDTSVNFPAPGGLPNAWQPAATPNGEAFSARWTGSIYLDDPSAYTFRVNASDRARVWIGRTRFGEQILDDWTGGGHVAMTLTTMAGGALAALGTQPGWYPIIIEYSEDTGIGGIVFESQRTGDGGTWRKPGADGPALSPLGIFEDVVRGESHYQMVKQIADTFGYQYMLEPMSLESGEFPGRLAPRVRVGRDYDLTTTEDDDTSLQAQGSAEDCVDTLVADAQGLADPVGATQLTAEVVNYDGVSQHLMVHSEAESLSDIANEQLLLQRLNSLLALRSSPFEQVSAVIETEGGERVLVPIPLTGVPTELAWVPGDGVRRKYPSLGVEDASQVQITTVSRKFVPDALGLPAVSYRPRPRSFRDFLARLQRQAVSPKRNYQGQTGPLQGTLGSNDATKAPDAYSRVALPLNLDDVVEAKLVVLTKSDASAWNLEVNGTVRINGITGAGLSDVHPWLARAVATEPLMHARLVSAGGGSTGTWQVVLRLVIRV